MSKRVLFDGKDWQKAEARVAELEAENKRLDAEVDQAHDELNAIIAKLEAELSTVRRSEAVRVERLEAEVEKLRDEDHRLNVLYYKTEAKLAEVEEQLRVERERK